MVLTTTALITRPFFDGSKTDKRNPHGPGEVLGTANFVKHVDQLVLEDDLGVRATRVLVETACIGAAGLWCEAYRQSHMDYDADRWVTWAQAKKELVAEFGESIPLDSVNFTSLRLLPNEDFKHFNYRIKIAHKPNRQRVEDNNPHQQQLTNAEIALFEGDFTNALPAADAAGRTLAQRRDHLTAAMMRVTAAARKEGIQSLINDIAKSLILQNATVSTDKDRASAKMKSSLTLTSEELARHLEDFKQQQKKPVYQGRVHAVAEDEEPAEFSEEGGEEAPERTSEETAFIAAAKAMERRTRAPKRKGSSKPRGNTANKGGARARLAPPTGPQSGGRPTSKCNYCQKKGHKEADCYSKHPEKGHAARVARNAGPRAAAPQQPAEAWGTAVVKASRPVQSRPSGALIHEELLQGNASGSWQL